MTLNITITQCPQGVNVAETRKSFVEQGGTIGRSNTNEWVLDDPECYLSAQHCRIECEGSQYFLADLSTNGTFINDSAEPLGKGTRVELKNGDRFIMGDYEFQVELQQSAQASSPPASFGGGGFADDPFVAPSGSLFAENKESPSDSSFFSSASPENSNTLFNITAEETDPLAALDGKAEQDQSNYALNDTSNSYGDGADGFNQSLNWPESAPEGGSVIPDDWDVTSMGEVKPPVPPAGNSQGSLTATGSQAAQKPMPAARRTEPEPANDVPVHNQQRVLEDVSPPAVKRKPPQQPARQRPTANNSDSSVSQVDTTLVSAMGLEHHQLSAERIAEINQIVGELVRETVIGLMQTLSSRSSIKNEFRMQMTTIQAVENNPLKFSATIDDALENMFIRQSKAYKTPVESVREGFAGIAEHQLAVVAGIRSAFKTVLECFDPVELEQRFEKHHKGAILLGSRKARLWDAFNDYYRSLADDMDGSFQFLFGDEFVRAYEDQLTKLAQTRNSNKVK